MTIARMFNCTSSGSVSDIKCLPAISPMSCFSSWVNLKSYNINTDGLLIWQFIAPSQFIPEAAFNFVYGLDALRRTSTLSSGWNGNDGSEFVMPNIITIAEISTQVNRISSGVEQHHGSQAAVSILLFLYYAVRSGNETAKVRF